MIGEIEIIDGHVHAFTRELAALEKQQLDGRDERYCSAWNQWQEWFKKKYDPPLLDEDSIDEIPQLAKTWLERFDTYGIDAGVFLAIRPEEETLTEFRNAGDGRFHLFTTVDPFDKDSPGILRRRVTEQGFRGLKLYPTTYPFLPSDKKIYPIYEEARSLGIPLMFHLGITLNYETDLRYCNPIELHPVLKDFPELNIIVPHFGAGYFQELLFLAYHTQNLYLDSSGTNVWMKYLPYPITLKEVFMKALDVFGPERLIFGTDSRALGFQNYREWCLYSHLGILREIRMEREQVSLVMGQNIKRLMGLG